MFVCRLNICRSFTIGREVDQSLVLQLRDQFLLRLVLRLAGDRAEQTAGRFLESCHGAIGKRVAFLAPEIPADIAGHVLGIELHASNTIRAASMTSLPIPSPGIQAIVYLAIGAILSARVATASHSNRTMVRVYPRITRITQM